MGSVCCCCFQNEAEEYAKLTAQEQPKYNTDDAVKPKTKLSISRSLTKDKLFLVQIGILGDIEIYEKRCWLLRLLDGDQFETEKQTKKEELRNNQISQCNKKFKMNDENYCSQLQLINDMVFLDDNEDDSIIIGNHDFDINKYNALLLCYDITSLHSFNKLREYLDTIRNFERCDTLQVGIMGIFPSCDVVGNEGSENQRKVGGNEAEQLCTEYKSINIEFVGETNAKTGQNVGELVQNMIQKCVDTQSIE